ncbi:Ppx/GppA phosphatase family protein [Amycolatopsis benzoatilytica]|uniref:Ppx/GppA phosphatase family protein n=1 Tax=Amycolatopsis benzoatilytica TaxID=346045 RepID=UPI00036873C1|nr:exopolyphosphatase [Amycolatopsis benzoatilytica]
MRKIEGLSAAVLDVGSFSARLVVLEPGGSPMDPVLTHQTRLRLDRELDDEGRLSRSGVKAVAAAVRTGMEVAREHGVQDVFPLATSSIRDAVNAREAVREVAGETGVELRFLSGRREAELTYVGARRWYGAAGGPLLALDIGGGTVELSAGSGEQATFARSLPLGARSVTRDWLPAEPPVRSKQVRALRDHALEEVAAALGDVKDELAEHRVAGCSKVLRQLARLAGDRPGRTRELHLEDVREWIPRLSAMPSARRAQLPGISRQRAQQALGGAIVAEALLTVAGGKMTICPWSTRDGLLLTLLDQLTDATGKKWSRPAA